MLVARRWTSAHSVERSFVPSLAASCVHSSCPQEPGPKHPGGRFSAWHATTAATVGLSRSMASPGRAMDKPRSWLVTTHTHPSLQACSPTTLQVPHHDLPHRHAVFTAPSPDPTSVQGAQSLTRTTLGPRMCAFGLWRGGEITPNAQHRAVVLAIQLRLSARAQRASSSMYMCAQWLAMCTWRVVACEWPMVWKCVRGGWRCRRCAHGGWWCVRGGWW